MKGLVHQEDTTINIDAPNTGVPKNTKQMLTEIINSNIVIVVDLNTPLSTMDRSFKESVRKPHI